MHNMLQTVNNSDFSRTMDLFKEIDDLSDLLLLEKNTKLDCAAGGGYEDLQSKYSSLHENYAKEIENSKKVEKCLIKCLKFYSKLSKKYELQQQIIRDLEENIKEKVNSLEEAEKNEEKLKGLIEVYRTERTLYAGQTAAQLRKEKEMLLDVCCRLIGESVRSSTASNFCSLLLRKFRKDMSDDQIFLLKVKSMKFKDELEGDGFKDFKPDPGALKDEFKSEDKYNKDVTKVEVKESADETETYQLSPCTVTVQENSYVSNESQCSDKSPLREVEQEEAETVPSLPSLEEVPPSIQSDCDDAEERDPDDVPISVVREIDFRKLEKEGSLSPGPMSRRESIIMDNKSEYPEKPSAVTENAPKHCESPQTAKVSNSIFDICDPRPDVNDSREKSEQKENEFFSGVFFTSDYTPDKPANESNADIMDDNSTSLYELEVFRIFKEMSSIRPLSPIRESSRVNAKPFAHVQNENKNPGDGNSEAGLKRNSKSEESHFQNKKMRTEEERPGCCLLDSIMSAMSNQNEEFKSKKFEKKESEGSREIQETSPNRPKTYPRRSRKENCTSDESPGGVVGRSPRRNKGKLQSAERTVTEELKKFVSSQISCKEDAERQVKVCLSALGDKSEEMIAKCVVAMVLENVDEAVEVFERPAPPLTKTQNRLIVLLSVFRTLNWDSDKISTKILSIISEKLYPDTFFWPDDSVEAAARFYAALCKARNDPKTLWKFCLSAMTDMRQRCPLVVFTVLKTWPDVLHDASKLKNNPLALTVVNVFLHMPKTEGLRNTNQKRKLAALKHLLVNFYEFKMEDSIEGYAKKLVEGIRREEAGAEKSIALLCKCRDQGWTVKNVVPALKGTLVDWYEGRTEDSVADAVLSVIKQICPMLPQESGGKVQDLAHYLSHILVSRKKSHDSEVNLIEVLLLLKQYPEVRKTICEWIPKSPISAGLRNEIINASADNILRELKMNKKKEAKNNSPRKKHWKKPKGKKKKEKKKKDK